MSVLSLPSVWATGPPHRAGSPSGEDYASDFLLMPRGTGFPASSSCPRGPLTSIPCCTCLLGKVKVKVAWSCPAVCDPMDHTVHGILQARILEWKPFPSPGDFPKTEIELRSPTLQVDSLLSELPRKPNNTGVGSLSLLQGIFLT